MLVRTGDLEGDSQCIRTVLPQGTSTCLSEEVLVVKFEKFTDDEPGDRLVTCLEGASGPNDNTVHHADLLQYYSGGGYWMQCEANDQGWGNMKGYMGIAVENSRDMNRSDTFDVNRETVVTNLFREIIPHELTSYDVCGSLSEMPSNSTMQMKLFTNVGDGGGHEIEISKFRLVLLPRVLIARPFCKMLWLISIIKRNHSSLKISESDGSKSSIFISVATRLSPTVQLLVLDFLFWRDHDDTNLDIGSASDEDGIQEQRPKRPDVPVWAVEAVVSQPYISDVIPV